MNALEPLWQLISTEYDFLLIAMLWAIALYLYGNSLYADWIESLTHLFRLDSQDVSFRFYISQVLVVIVCLCPFFLLGVLGHLLFLWGFGHIWSVSVAVFGCISGAIYELIRQNDTLGSD